MSLDGRPAGMDLTYLAIQVTWVSHLCSPSCKVVEPSAAPQMIIQIQYICAQYEYVTVCIWFLVQAISLWVDLRNLSHQVQAIRIFRMISCRRSPAPGSADGDLV